VLFPALVRKSGGALDGAIAALVQEHVDFKGYIATLDRLDLDSAADRIEFAQVAHRYVEELRQHIFRENREVYAAARQLFTDDELFGLLSDADATGRADSMQGCGERHAASLMQWQARFFAAAKIKTDDPAVG
jgi:hemerythrin-like domain-containing protein